MNSAGSEASNANHLRLMKDTPLIDSGASSPESEFQLAYRRLEYLYEIGKRLTRVNSVEETFPEVLTLVKGTFAIQSAVLVENRGGAVRTVIWPSSGLSDEHVNRMLSTA